MKTSVKTKKIVAIIFVLIFIAGVTAGCYFGAKEFSQSNYFNMNSKVSRFERNEKIFSDSLYSVFNGNTDALEILSVEDGAVQYDANAVLKKKNVTSVIGKNSVIDYILDTSFYESGYLYSESSENIFPVHIDDEDLMTEDFIKQDDGTLVKGNYKEILSDSENWLVVKEIKDNWYYYEYHSN